MKIHNFDQRSPEWKQIRLGKFGSTDAQALSVNGKGLETLIYQKVAEKMTGQFEEGYTNSDMERGVEQEGLARASYEMQTGNMVTQVGYVELDEYTGCSPDGLVGDDGLVEIKCMRMAGYVRTKHTQKIDSGYVKQMQHQMFVTGRKWCDFVVFNENFSDVVIIRVDRDNKTIDKIKTGLEAAKAKIQEVYGSI